MVVMYLELCMRLLATHHSDRANRAAAKYAVGQICPTSFKDDSSASVSDFLLPRTQRSDYFCTLIIC